MVAIMAKPVEQTAYDNLVVLAKTQATALGRLYELYYDRIFRFCVHRLFNRSTAKDVSKASEREYRSGRPSQHRDA